MQDVDCDGFLECLAGNDDADPQLVDNCEFGSAWVGEGSELHQTYYLAVTGFSGESGSFTLGVTCT